MKKIASEPIKFDRELYESDYKKIIDQLSGEIKKIEEENPEYTLDKVAVCEIEDDFVKNVYSAIIILKPKEDFFVAFMKLKSQMFPDNPHALEEIQRKLEDLNNEKNLLSIVISRAAKKDIKNAIEGILLAYQDNPEMVIETIGKETWYMIAEYVGFPQSKNKLNHES